jgi:hypothetical protein
MMKRENKKTGNIRNAEFMTKTAFEKREFLILCRDEKDANSKRVSLYNVRKTLPESLQVNVAIRKQKIGESWGVRIYYEESQVLEIINGELVNVVEGE